MKQKRPRAAQFILEDRLTPPTYQVELVCSALHNNTVLCVSNDSGLPFVPIMLIKCMYEQESRQSGGHRICVYLSPDGEEGTCEKNADTIRMHSTLRVSVLSAGSSQVSSVIDTSDVVCMSASLCLTLVQDGSLDFSQLNLVVFDECHVAVVDGSPYAGLVSLLKQSPQFDLVRLFGMTSSIIGGLVEDPDELEWKITQLESVLASTAETMSDLNAMDTPAGKREEIIAAYDASDTRAHSLTEDIRVTLKNAYHFLGDMIISQADAVRAREEMVGKKGKTKVATDSTSAKANVVEPPEHSVEWYNLQMFKEAPRKVFTEVEMTLDELGPWCAGCVALNLCSTLEKIIDKTAERLEKQLLQLAWTHLKYIHMLVKQASEAVEDYTELLDMSTPKVRQLMDVLKSYLPKVDFEITSAISTHNRAIDLSSDYSDFSDLSDGESAQDQETFTIAKLKHCGEQDHVVKVNQEETTLNGLVFVNRKLSAYALHKYIEELCVLDCDLYFIRSSYLIGDSDEGNDEPGRNKKQEQKLIEFRQHKVNLLVGTNILESNLDIPKCNLICMFDRPQSYRSYIRTKNRAKAFNAKYYSICSTEEKAFFEKYMGDFSKIEMILQSKCHEFNRSNTSGSQPIAQTYDRGEALLPPFVAPGTEATVTVNNAIGLLNRYCAKLPSDIYTRLTPRSSVSTVDNGYQATIQLPVNCRLKHTITGEVMPTEQMAIAAAALETCKELFHQGELDAHLAPIGKEYLRSPKQDAEWESESKGRHCKGIPGSAKRKQSYPKAIADIFHDPVTSGETCYLYAAKQTLSIPMDQDKHNRGRDIFVTEEHPYTIGFLCRNKLPQVAEFPVFTRSGQECVSVSYCTECRLSQTEYEQVTRYHSFVFHNVLRIDKFPLKLGPDKSKFNLLVVPIATDDYNIAWEYLDRTLTKMVEWTHRLPLFSRKTKQFTFVEKEFRDAVVMPSYRNQDHPEFFYVAALRRDLSPKSPFPSPDLYSSFYTYYTSKYGLEITNTTQPLLDVDRTSGRLNLMTPRFMNQKGMPLPASSSSSKKNKKMTTRERQILIPELCDIHPCSASTWRKLVCVPTIIYRLNSLMLSHQLLCRINRGMQLDCLSHTQVPSGDKLDLGVDFSLLAPSTSPDAAVSTTSPLDAVGSTQTSQPSADIDPDKAAEELVSGLQDIDFSAEPNISAATELNTTLSSDGSDSDEISEEEEEEEGEDASIPTDLQLDREEASLSQSGPTVTMILHALTMSNASDFINLERLETVGDSFLKFAVTLYLFCAHPGLHEGRLSYGRGKQVSNFNLYLLGKKLGLHGYLMSEKFEPAENWLPPGYVLEDVQPMEEFHAEGKAAATTKPTVVIPYNLRTQHSLPDKSIADCVESLIGCYLTSCGPYAARVFMAWLGINVLPSRELSLSTEEQTSADNEFSLPQPPSGLISSDADSQLQLDTLYSGLEHFEQSLGYKFNDKAYLVQAFTHSSYVHNKVTDCYQRLEFLGDAVLDYVITRRLFEDKRKHSPGILTDLRSALVNNNVFAALAVKWDFHKYIKFISTQMYVSIHRFVQHQKSRQDRIQVEQYLRLSEGDNNEGEEVEIPKVLGDVFESVAGAIYIDSNMSLDTLWGVYFPLMRQQIVQFSKRIPKSPVRELLEREPETAKFQKPERTKDGKARVSVTVAGKDTWWGVGRSYRMAKSAAAKKALIALNAMERAGH